MSQIELSSIVIEGLKSLNTVITSDLTKKIISNAVKMALHSDASKSTIHFNIIDKQNENFSFHIFKNCQFS